MWGDKGDKHTWATYRENYAPDFNSTITVRLTNLDDRLWIIYIVKLASSAGDDGPSFTKNVSSSWNLQSVRHQVGTGIKEDDLAPSELSIMGETSIRR